MEEWTSQDEELLKKLQAEDEASGLNKEGSAAVDQVDQHRLKDPAPGQKQTSYIRATAGMIRDTFQNWFDFAESLGHASSTSRAAAKSALGLHFGDEVYTALGHVIPGGQIAQSLEGMQHVELPHLKGEENASTTENVIRSVGGYLLPFATWGKAFSITKGASWLGRAGRAMLAGAATDFTSQRPAQANLANAIKDTFHIDNQTLNDLASEEDDNTLAARFKAAAVNAPISVATDAALEGGLRMLKAYRAWKGSLEEADALVKTMREPAQVEVPKMPKATPEEVQAAKSAAANDNGVRVSQAIKPEVPEAVVPGEDILGFLQRKVLEGATPEEVDKLGAQLIDGNPINVLQKVGINPLKVDFSKFDNPEMLGKLQEGLAHIYETIAQRLGRSGVRVTEAMTARAARALGTTGDALKDLYGRTANLDAVMYASQAFVGAHAGRLLADAQAALKAIEAGGGEAEWLKFLESFQRHAYFLGALRGAGSEVGRALRSLRHIQSAGKAVVKRDLKAAAKTMEGTPDALLAQAKAKLASDAVSQMETAAERITFLNDLVEKGSDVEALTRFTRAKAGSTLRRLDAAVGETRGNLFASTTAMMNTFSNAAMLGLRGVAKWMSAMKAAALSPFGKGFSMEARIRALDAWAYTDGIMSSWRAAWQNTLALMEREGMAEVALNLNTFGARQLAAKAASMSAEGTRKIGRNNFERIDINARDRAFAMSAADIRKLDEVIASWDMNKLTEHSLRWLVRTVAPVVNAAGTMSRLGTTLFVNVPDQFVGTMAAKAGAQSHAIRLAAQEAAELGLEGPELTKYLKARMVQLSETVNGFADDAFSKGQQEVALAHGDAEARIALFQDKPETFIGAGITNSLGRWPFFNIFVPFVRTPMRILERTLIDYTPLGLLKDRVRADILAGGARRDEALARMGLGMMLVYSGFMMAEDRRIVGQDGDYKSTARLDRPSYSLKIGNDYYEFKRIDPLGTLLGWGADVRAYLDDQEKNDAAPGKAAQMIEAALWATQANVLSKTWLTSIRNIVELADASSDPEFHTRLTNYLATFGTRVVPGSGFQRSIEEGVDGNLRDASNFIEGTIKASAGAETLPLKRDHILGRPVEVDLGDKFVGLRGGPQSADPLIQELERLSFDLPAARRTERGVKLTSAQFSRWLELRGQVIKHPKTGLTLEDTLRTLIDLPAYQQLPRSGKVKAMRDEMNGFSRLATEQLLREDHDFAYKALRKEVWDRMELQGASQEQKKQETAKLAHDLGLDQ